MSDRHVPNAAARVAAAAIMAAITAIAIGIAVVCIRWMLHQF